MIFVDFQYRHFIALQIPKIVAYLDFPSHLKNANPNAGPIEAAIFFKNVWFHKYSLYKNNILFRNEVGNFKNQLELAERRLQKVRLGNSLNLGDFENFDKNSKFFKEAQFLMETFYEDLEMFSDHFFPKNKFKIRGLTAVPTVKNGSEIVKMRDFAEHTLPKNGPAANLTDQESIFESRDFAAETLKKTAMMHLYLTRSLSKTF